MQMNIAIKSYLKRKLKSVFYTTILSPITYKGLTDWAISCEIFIIKDKAKNC